MATAPKATPLVRCQAMADLHAHQPARPAWVDVEGDGATRMVRLIPPLNLAMCRTLEEETARRTHATMEAYAEQLRLG